MISLIVWLRVDPAQLDTFLEAMGDNASASREEPGCRGFEIHQGQEDPTRFVLVELYDDDASLAAHHQSEHFALWKERSKDGMVIEKESLRALPRR